LATNETRELGDTLIAELPWLIGLATRLTRDPEVAEDCAQETLIAAWRRHDQLRDPAALRGWLRRTLVNKVIDRSRTRRDTLDIESVEREWADDAWTVQPEAVIERSERREDLEDALTRLPTILRVPVVLHDAVGWTSQEIAESLGIGLPAAKQRLRRGRMMLVSALAGRPAATSPRTWTGSWTTGRGAPWRTTSRAARRAHPCTRPSWACARAWTRCATRTRWWTRPLRHGSAKGSPPADGRAALPAYIEGV
jgi:RNA polymerase sigma factor (sigma-70 family)